MEDESQAEDVTDGLILCLHVLDIDDFRCDIAWRAASYEQILRAIRELCQSEVGYHAIKAAFWSEDKIFWFEVAVHDFSGVHGLESLEDGLDDGPDLCGFEFIFGFDFIIELSSLKQLYDNI